MKKCLLFLVAAMLSLASFASPSSADVVSDWDKPLTVKPVKFKDAFIPDYSFKSFRIFDPTEYYWFDANTGEYLHQNTIEQEMFDTQYNEGTYLPKTLREMGYAPSSVIYDPPNDPQPQLPWADKYLYSHP
jgi:hypothetical protein